MAEDWRKNLVTDPAGIADVVRLSRRIAVLGIKPESRADQPAHYVPEYLHASHPRFRMRTADLIAEHVSMLAKVSPGFSRANVL